MNLSLEENQFFDAFCELTKFGENQNLTRGNRREWKCLLKLDVIESQEKTKTKTGLIDDVNLFYENWFIGNFENEQKARVKFFSVLVFFSTSNK